MWKCPNVNTGTPAAGLLNNLALENKWVSVWDKNQGPVVQNMLA